MHTYQWWLTIGIFGLIALSSSLSFAQAPAQWTTAYAKPEKVIEYEDGKSTTALSGDTTIRTRCEIFRKFVLLIKRDPGLKGDTLSIRERTLGKNAANTCSKSYQGTSKDLPSGWLDGVIGPWLVLLREPIGTINNAQIVDLDSGKEVFHFPYDENPGFELKQTKNGKWAVKYFQALDMPDKCDVVRNLEACLKALKKKNPKVKIPFETPDCSKLPQRALEQGAVNLSIETEVENLQNPNPKNPSGKLTCSESV